MKAPQSMTLRVSGVASASLLLFTIASHAQTPRFRIATYTDRGGGVSSGGVFTMSGTIGQSEVSSVTNGVFTVGGGFWAAVIGDDNGLPRLRIALVAGDVVLAWPDPSTGFQLEAALTPLGPGWTTVSQAPLIVAGEKRVTLTPTGQGRMFRLSKP